MENIVTQETARGTLIKWKSNQILFMIKTDERSSNNESNRNLFKNKKSTTVSSFCFILWTMIVKNDSQVNSNEIRKH